MMWVRSGWSDRTARSGIVWLAALALQMTLVPAAVATEQDRISPRQKTEPAAATGDRPETMTGSFTYRYDESYENDTRIYDYLLEAPVTFDASYSTSYYTYGYDLYYADNLNGSFTAQGERHEKLGCQRNYTYEASGSTPPGTFKLLLAHDESWASVEVKIYGSRTDTEGEPSNPSPSCVPGEPVTYDYVPRIYCVGTPSRNANGDLEIDFTWNESIGHNSCTGAASGNSDNSDNSPGLEVELAPYDADGEPIDGVIAPGQELFVEATLKNDTLDTLDSFEIEGAELMSVDSRSPGGLVVLDQDVALDAGDLVLQAGDSRTIWYRLTATKRGLVALNSRVTALDPDGDQVEAAQSLRADVEDGHVVDEAVGRWVMLQALDRYLMSMYRDWVESMDRRGAQLKKQLSKILSPLERLAYFGSKKGLKISPFEHLQALLRSTGDKHVGAHLPNRTFKGHTIEELNGAYDDAFLEEVGKGAKEWAKNWGAVGKKAKKGAKAAYAESLLATFYFLGNATPQERMEFEARMIAFADNNTTSKNNLINTIKREIPRWQENGTYMWEAVEMSAKDVTLQSPDLKTQLKQESTWRKNMLKNADRDPVRFQQEWAKRDAEIFNLGLPLIFDTLVGGGVQKLGAVKITGRGTAVVSAGEASGVITPKGKVVKGPTTAIGDLEGPSSVTGGAGARTTEEFLSNVDGATLVRADDFGNVYELPNVGGVPEITLDAKAGILGELQDEYLAATGKHIKLVEVLKPSSPYRKPGGVAKLELTEQKTGKAQMIDAGAPEATFTEASVWRNTEHPSAQPGWKELPKARQDAAVKAWNKANDEWAKWENPPPGSKTERIQECIGQKSRVPLDLEPNKAGIQRFVTAEFEVVEVVEGTAEAKLIRVKSYEVEVVDTNSGRVVNRKTVVDSEVALPQTPDADAVAVGKQKLDGSGNPVFDDQGRPVIEPLTRAEREFVMQRYIDKNVKARRNGTIPDAAEHGVTLVMDDASAQAAGKLLPSYGVPFLSETVGSNYLRRIAPFVKPKGMTDDAMYAKMLELVQSEGGFGQHAVVLTVDTRYLGDLAVSSW